MISNTFIYTQKTEEFVESLIKEDYNNCMDLMAMDHADAKNVNTDTVKAVLANFRSVIVENWGTNLEFSFMESKKTFSTNETENTPPNTTLVLVEFHNNKELGVLQAVFDDPSKKILNIKTLQVKQPVPEMGSFWLFGLLALSVPVFNIYVLRKIKRSNLKRKGLKYAAVIFFNVPAITYAAVAGLSWEINFQILLGISFGYTGYFGSYWTFGIPLGGLYWLWKLHRQRHTSAVATFADESIGNASEPNVL